jgi:hypothetical protein
MTARASTPVQEALVRNGAPTYLGSIVVSGSSLTNATTASPFNNTGEALSGKYLVLVASAAVQFRFGTAPTAVATDFDIAANGTWEGWAPEETGTLLAILGTATVDVYEKT